MSARAARWKTRSASVHAASTARYIGNVGLDNLKSRIAVVLLQIAAPADNEIVEHANMPAFVDQPIDKMTSDEARSALSPNQPQQPSLIVCGRSSYGLPARPATPFAGIRRF